MAALSHFIVSIYGSAKVLLRSPNKEIFQISNGDIYGTLMGLEDWGVVPHLALIESMPRGNYRWLLVQRLIFRVIPSQKDELGKPNFLKVLRQ